MRSYNAFNKSEPVKENMKVYKDCWHKELCLLVEAVDEISPAEEFLYICEYHAKENVEQIEMILRSEGYFMVIRSK